MTALTIFMLAAITFATRYLFLEGRLPVRLGPNLKHLLGYSVPAVLAAITAPIIFVHRQQLDFAMHNQYIWAAAVAVFVAHKTASIYWTLGMGMLVFFAGRLFDLITG